MHRRGLEHGRESVELETFGAVRHVALGARSAEPVEALTDEASLEALLVPVVPPCPEVVPPTGVADGEERGEQNQVFLAPVSGHVEPATDDMSDATFDLTTANVCVQGWG